MDNFAMWLGYGLMIASSIYCFVACVEATAERLLKHFKFWDLLADFMLYRVKNKKDSK